MSMISGRCSESSAQTLFNQHIQELQRDKLVSKDPLQQPTDVDSLKSPSALSESSVATQKVTEPGKGQLIDLHA